MERPIAIDLGDLRTRAVDLLEGAAIDFESAAAPVYPRFSWDAEDGAPPDPSERASSAAPAPPEIVGMGDGGGYMEVGVAAADRDGLEAFVAARPTVDKLVALARAALFALARGGDAVRVVFVADPGEKADRLEEAAEALEGSRPVSALVRRGGPLETRRLAIEARCVPAGEALFEWCFARDVFDGEGAPAVALDLGHRATRFYLLDPASGVADQDVIPHGGESLLAHACRYARERGAEPHEPALLREIRAGLDAITVGGLTYPAARFFTLPREDLAKAIAAAAAARLRRHLERGGRWPRALVVAGGLAAPCAALVRARLAERGLDFPPPIVAPAAPLEGAIAGLTRSPLQG